MSPSLSSNTSKASRYAIVLVFAYFLFQIAPCLRTRFAPDDMQNLHTYWVLGPLAVLKAIVLCATAAYRPMGGAYYLPLYYAFGLNPLPFRIVCGILLCGNFWLFYAVARRLTTSLLAALFAVIIGCIHGNAIGAYASNSTIYDLLCFTFFHAALLFYLRGGNRVLVAILFVCALDSKEMAVVFVPALLLYEALFNWPLTKKSLGVIAVLGVIDAAFVAAKLFLPNAISSYAAYTPEFTAARFLVNLRGYLDLLFLTENQFSTGLAAAFWIAMIVPAFILRSRTLRFAAVFAFLSFLPLMFVPTREGFVLYMPLVGLGIYFGELLARIIPEILQTAVFVALIAGLGVIHYQQIDYLLPFTRHSQEVTAAAIAELRNVRGVQPGARILLLDNPFGSDWDIYFIAKLYFRDPTLQVAVLFPGESSPQGDVFDHFNHIFRWVDGRLVEELPPPEAK